MKKMTDFYDEVVNYELVYNDYTIKIFKNKKSEFYAHVVYEDDTTAELIYQSKRYGSCATAKQDAMQFIEMKLEK
jgi:hypothetical protein